ncbi:hypothetical protein [Flavobacterium sp. Arc2]|uniref:hypothetical protein n=1 Tax=Flavobacterium sp. Arc2 TaxID=3046685 RepID=UPI00352E2832
MIPLATLQSHKYLIKFSSFDIAAIPEGVSIPIVNLVIELLDPIEEYNSSSTLFRISSIIENYIINHNVILYCYCDIVEIKKSEKKNSISNQEFRSRLFCRMFERHTKGNYINKVVIIDDEIANNHYIHLITENNNKDFIDIITDELTLFDK